MPDWPIFLVHSSPVCCVNHRVGRPHLLEQLNTAFHTHLPATFLFDYGSMRAIAEHLTGPDAQLPCKATCKRAQRTSQGLAMPLPGVVSRLAGARDTAQLCALGTASGDAVHLVPRLRWIPTPTSPSAERHGGFVADAHRFDNTRFGVSPAEVRATDPQQRLLLEVAYASLHAIGERSHSLRAADLGVFLGIMNADFSSLQKGNTVYAATGAAISVAAGRLSFVLGTQGPCISYDTACSSSLVALHGAWSCVAAEEYWRGLVLAVSLMLTPRTHHVYAHAGMLAPNGRCRTFDMRADGYVRSEGVGAHVLCEEARGPTLLGGFVRSDGRSASLTAPSGAAQARLIKTALSRASEDALASIEAHGTGTPLGDPTELGGLQRALCPASGPCVGSAKACLGHAEPVAGLAGLLALVQMEGQGLRTLNAQLRVLNPLLNSPLHTLQAGISMQGAHITEAKVKPQHQLCSAQHEFLDSAKD